MNDYAPARLFKPTETEVGMVWMLRIVAGVSLVTGVLYWIRLVGWAPGPENRFDLMPLHWQVAAVTLGVLYPFAAIGLWMLASWGPVIWFACAGAELVMYGLFPDMYGHRTLLLYSHGLTIALYAVLRYGVYWQKRHNEG